MPAFEVDIWPRFSPIRKGWVMTDIVDELRDESIFDPIRQRAAHAIELLRIQSAARLKIINDKLAIIDNQRDALREAERFMEYFANETDGRFIGSGTPTTCLAEMDSRASSQLFNLTSHSRKGIPNAN